MKEEAPRITAALREALTREPVSLRPSDSSARSSDCPSPRPFDIRSAGLLQPRAASTDCSEVSRGEAADLCVRRSGGRLLPRAAAHFEGRGRLLLGGGADAKSEGCGPLGGAAGAKSGGSGALERRCGRQKQGVASPVVLPLTRLEGRDPSISGRPDLGGAPRSPVFNGACVEGGVRPLPGGPRAPIEGGRTPKARNEASSWAGSDRPPRDDRLTKRLIYAEAGVQELWTLDVDGTFELWRGAHLGELTTLSPEDTVATPLLPDFELSLADVFRGL